MSRSADSSGTFVYKKLQADLLTAGVIFLVMGEYATIVGLLTGPSVVAIAAGLIMSAIAAGSIWFGQRARIEISSAEVTIFLSRTVRVPIDDAIEFVATPMPGTINHTIYLRRTKGSPINAPGGGRPQKASRVVDQLNAALTAAR